MQVYNTGDASSRFTSTLLYGLAGSGKTPLAATLPNALVVASEPGLLSLKAARLPYVVARDYAETMAVLKWIKGSSEVRQYQSIFFDSISALSENIMVAEKKKSNDPRKFSPATTALTMEVVLDYLTIQGKHVVMTCKANEVRDQITGARTVEPFAVVPKLGPLLPYHFDSVFYVSRHRVADTGAEYAMLTCRANDLCIARNRSGMLDLYEPPNLGQLINKMNGVS